MSYGPRLTALAHLSQRKKFFFLSAVFFFGWLVAALFSFDAAFISKLFFQSFAGGRSFYKDYFLLVWLSLSFLLLFFNWKWDSPYWERYLWFFSGSAFLLHFIAHLYFTHKYGLNVSDYVIAYSNGHFSSNQITHTHLFKSIFAALLTSVRNPLVLADAGYPYFDFLPRFFPWVALVLVLPSLGLLLSGVVRVAGKQGPSTPLAYPLLYALVSYAVAKSSIDGGPFSVECMLAVPVLIALFRQRPENTVIDFAKRVLRLFFLFFVLGVLLYAYLQRSLPVGFVSAGSYVGLTFFAVFTIPFLLGRENLSAHRWVLAVFIPMMVFVFQSPWFPAFRHLAMEINPGDVLYIKSIFGLEFPYPVLWSDGRVRIHKFTSNEKVLMGVFFRDYHLAPFYDVTNIADKTCTESIGYVVEGEVYGSVDLLPDDLGRPSPFLNSVDVQSCGQPKNCLLTIKAEIKGCLPNAGRELELNHLNLLGLKRFIYKPKEISAESVSPV